MIGRVRPLNISRRAVLGGLTVLSLSVAAKAESSEDLSVDAGEGPMALTRFAAAGAGKRPAVIVLHGARGVELKPRAYQRYAVALSAIGIDAYLARYFTRADQDALDPKTTTSDSRQLYETARFGDWAKRISAVVTAILARRDNSGRVGLLGFSLGSYVAADTAAHDDRVTALAALYGGMPEAVVSQVTHMPPLLELHGDADRNVPLAKGTDLVRLAKAVGAPAEQVVYPGRQHGFDFADDDPMTTDAIARVVRFFQARLTT
jgi:carboxymethylenebutenolidase